MKDTQPWYLLQVWTNEFGRTETKLDVYTDVWFARKALCKVLNVPYGEQGWPPDWSGSAPDGRFTKMDMLKVHPDPLLG